MQTLQIPTVPFDFFKKIEVIQWDTLLFFFGVILCVGALSAIGYLALGSQYLYHELGSHLSSIHQATPANILVGIASAIVDNIPVMYAVLTMHPIMSQGQWLLVTLTAGVGGSLLSVGSAAGVALMGQSKGQYTFFYHLKWTWAIFLGYIASIAVHLWVNNAAFLYTRMNIYIAFSILMTIAIAIAYLNYRFIKMPTTTAIMVGSILLSLLLLLCRYIGLEHFELQVEHLVRRLHFHDLLINGMLSFLLFAGALTIDWETFKKQRWEILILSTLGTIASTLLLAILTYYFLAILGIKLPFIYCILFGALLSPTDPIAVLAMLSNFKAPKKLKVIIAGESLFNDGVGIVIFITAYQLAFTHTTPSVHGVLLLFSRQAIGGILYGALLGWTCRFLILGIDDEKLQILLTIAIATSGYIFAQYLRVSGPLAMVVAGMFIGHACRAQAHSKASYKILQSFWEVIDELLNMVLFLLIGFEILLMRHYAHQIWACLISILAILIVRSITVIIPMTLFKLKRKYPPDTINILIWGGLRGGLAVALALSLPENSYRDLIVSMTYAVVIFSILIQGTSIKFLIKRSLRIDEK